jgi:DNA (cytosine-5)-methyltransferase 1
VPVSKAAAMAQINRLNTDSMITEPQCLTPRRTELAKQLRKQGETERFANRKYQPRTDGVSNTVTHIQKDNMIQEPEYRIRKLTPVETGRLMGLRDDEIEKMKACGISKSAMYKLHGNSIVVDVLFHIFRTMFIDTQPKNESTNLFNYE